MKVINHSFLMFLIVVNFFSCELDGNQNLDNKENSKSSDSTQLKDNDIQTKKAEFEGIKTIRSSTFKNVYLRMDGRSSNSKSGDGSGIVNCQFGPPSEWEKFKFIAQNDGTFAIESIAFPNVFLRMDGRNINSKIGDGGGKINCQSEVGSWEKFYLIRNNDGTFSIKSSAFPNVYIRMDGKNVTSNKVSGSGLVNCQFGASDWEKFYIEEFISSEN